MFKNCVIVQILIMDTIMEGNDEKVFAKKLKEWSIKGFPELGGSENVAQACNSVDVSGSGIGITVGKVVNHPIFMSDPQQAAKEVWELLDRNAAGFVKQRSNN